MLEERERRSAVAAARRGSVVLGEQLPSVPSRTLHCDAHEFQRLRGLSRGRRRASVCCLPLLSPLSRLFRAWTMFTTFVDLTYTAFGVALTIAFNENTYFAGSWLDYWDLIGGIAYYADLIVGFHVGVVLRWDTRAAVLCDGRSAAWFYVRHGTFIIDLIASLPAIIHLVARFAKVGDHTLRIFYIMRLLRLFRVWRLMRDITPGRSAGSLQPVAALLTTRTVLLFNALFSLAVLVNIMGCIWWNLAISQGFEHSWVAFVDNNTFLNLEEASDPARWLVCVFYALTTVTTIGFGDVSPVTTAEVGVTVCFELLGVAFFGYILNTITAILSGSGPAAKRAAAVRSKLQDVEAALHELQMPAFLQRKVRLYFSEQWAPQETGGLDLRQRLIADLPSHLRAHVIEQRQEETLKQLSFLPADLTDKQRKQVHRMLAEASVPVSLRAGQELEEAAAQVVAMGAASGPSCYILDEGEMRMLRAHEQGSTISQQDAQLAGDSRVDFDGPAIIGLAALFSEDAELAPGGGAGSGGAGGGRDGGGGGGGVEDAHPGAGLSDLSRPWHDRAVALTVCHLWRIDCCQFFGDLRVHQPRAMLHLLDRLLLSLGVRTGDAAGDAPELGRTMTLDDVAAPPGSGAAAAAAAADPKLQRQRGFRQHAVERLLHMRADLVATLAAEEEAEEALKTAGAVVDDGPSGLAHVSMMSAEDMDGSSSQLADISIDGGSMESAAPDVWHVWHGGGSRTKGH